MPLGVGLPCSVRIWHGGKLGKRAGVRKELCASASVSSQQEGWGRAHGSFIVDKRSFPSFPLPPLQLNHPDNLTPHSHHFHPHNSNPNHSSTTVQKTHPTPFTHAIQPVQLHTLLDRPNSYMHCISTAQYRPVPTIPTCTSPSGKDGLPY